MADAQSVDLSDTRLEEVSDAIHEHFNGFLSSARTQSTSTMRSCEDKRASIVSDFDLFYKKECSNVHADLPAMALTAMKGLHAKAKDSIQAMFDTFSASQRGDLEYFRTNVKELESDVTKTSVEEFGRLRTEAVKARQSMQLLRRQVATRSTKDESAATPQPIEAEEDNKEVTTPSPFSIAEFEAAHRRTENKGSRTQSSQAPIGKAAGTKPNPYLPDVTENVSTRSVMRNTLRNVFRTTAPGNSSPSEKPPRVESPFLQRQVHKRSPSGTFLPQTFSSMQPHQNAFGSTELENIHPIIGGPMKTGSKLNQEYEESVLAVNDEDLLAWEDTDDDDEKQRLGAEEFTQGDDFSKLSAQNDILFEENSKLSKENVDIREQNVDLREQNVDLHEQNEKYKEIIRELMNSADELKQDNEELRQGLSQGQPADDFDQTGEEVERNAQTDLEIPSSPEETMSSAPATPGKVDLPVHRSTKPSLHNPSASAYKPTYPLAPASSDMDSPRSVSQNAPKRPSTPQTRATLLGPGFLPTPAPSDAASLAGASQCPETAGEALVLLRAAVRRCDTEIQECQKDIEIPSGHETSPKYLLERWKSSTKRHRQDFDHTIMYLQRVINESPRRKHEHHGSSSSLAESRHSSGSPSKWLPSQTSQPTYRGWGLTPSNRVSDTSEETRFSSLFGRSSAASSMASSIFGGSTGSPSSYSRSWQKAVSSVRGSPDPVSSKSHVHEPESIPESSPAIGSSTQEGSSSTNGDRSKKSQSQHQSQNSQKSLGSDIRTRGNKSAPDGKKRGGDEDDDNEKKPKRGKYQPLLFESRSKTNLWRSTISYPLHLLSCLIESCVRASNFNHQFMRHLWHLLIKRNDIDPSPETPPSRVLYNVVMSILLLMNVCFLLVNVYSYIQMYRVRLALQGEWTMWLDANGLARELLLRRIATQPSRWSLWGLGEKQGLVWQSFGDFVEFGCWALGFGTLKEFANVLMLNLWAVVHGFSFSLWNS